MEVFLFNSNVRSTIFLSVTPSQIVFLTLLERPGHILSQPLCVCHTPPLGCRESICIHIYFSWLIIKGKVMSLTQQPNSDLFHLVGHWLGHMWGDYYLCTWQNYFHTGTYGIAFWLPTSRPGIPINELDTCIWFYWGICLHIVLHGHTHPDFDIGLPLIPGYMDQYAI